MQAAGNRNQRIVIERALVTRNEAGEETRSWISLAPLWAAAHPTRGREFFASGAEQSRADVVFRFPYRADLSERDRVVWRGERYAIVAPPVDVAGAREVTELYCVHGVKDGRP